MSAPKPIRHGSPGGARAHYRRGEKPCDRCRAAANASRHPDPYKAVRPAERAAPRNGLPVTRYVYGKPRPAWAVTAIRRAEAIYGTPGDFEEAS